MSISNGDFLISLVEAGRMLGGIREKTVRRRIAEGVLSKPVKEGNAGSDIHSQKLVPESPRVPSCLHETWERGFVNCWK